jgi:hypothetical protein
VLPCLCLPALSGRLFLVAFSHSRVVLDCLSTSTVFDLCPAAIDCFFFRRSIKALFAWLISHQPAVLFSQNKSATNNQPAVLFSHNKPAPAISHQPTEHAANSSLGNFHNES